jgi:serine/threonine protein kinase
MPTTTLPTIMLTTPLPTTLPTATAVPSDRPRWPRGRWALGIIIHEMLAGYPPFYHRDAFEIYQLVLNIKIDTDLFPTHFDKFAKEILQKLLTKSAAARIGSSKNGAEDIKKHKWYRARPQLGGALQQADGAADRGVQVPAGGEVGHRPQTLPEGLSRLGEDVGPSLEPDRDSILFGGWEHIFDAEADLSPKLAAKKKA